MTLKRSYSLFILFFFSITYDVNGFAPKRVLNGQRNILSEFSDFNFGFQRLSFFLSNDLFEYETESSQAEEAGLLSGQI